MPFHPKSYSLGSLQLKASSEVIVPPSPPPTPRPSQVAMLLFLSLKCESSFLDGWMEVWVDR